MRGSDICGGRGGKSGRLMAFFWAEFEIHRDADCCASLCPAFSVGAYSAALRLSGAMHTRPLDPLVSSKRQLESGVVGEFALSLVEGEEG